MAHRLSSRIVFAAATGVASISVLGFAQIAFAQSAATACPFEWSRDLRVGATGSDVLQLQRFLNSNGFVVTQSGAGSSGSETMKFGGLTKQAVIRFQETYAADILIPNGLSSGTGTVGPSTRAKLNALCATMQSSAASAVTVSVADQLVVSDPGQAPTPLVPAGSGAGFLTFTLTAGSKDVTVSNMVFERVGVGNDRAFDNVALYDQDNLQVGNLLSFDSAHRATLRQPFTVLAGTSQTYILYGIMDPDLTDFVGQMPAIQLDSITASSPLSGVLPLRGPFEPLDNSLVIGGATAELSQFDPSADNTHYIGDKNIRFSGIRIGANSQEDLSLYNIIWEQNGTASAQDIANVSSVVNGKEYPAVVRGKEYISTFDPAIVIPKGQAIDLYIKGDLTTSGANRTVKFDIHDNTDDVNLAGNTYNFGVGIVPEGNTATDGNSVFLTDTGDTDGDSLTPFFSGSVVNIRGGSAVSISK